ncbi:MAG: hypothetical protein V1756_01505 [Patescibacteria group bacterium]
MFKKYFSKITPYFAAALFSPKPLTGFKFFDLDNYTLDMPWLKWPMLFAVVFAAVSFAIGAYYVSKYTKGFYAGRGVPKFWKYILWGIFVTAIAEVGEICLFYETAAHVGLIERYLFLDLPHVLGGVFLAVGAYNLFKEVTS